MGSHVVGSTVIPFIGTGRPQNVVCVAHIKKARLLGGDYQSGLRVVILADPEWVCKGVAYQCFVFVRGGHPESVLREVM